MVLLYLIEELFIGLFLLLVVTQVAIPMITDRPLFPFFRGWRSVRHEVAELNAQEEAKTLRAELHSRREALDKDAE